MFVSGLRSILHIALKSDEDHHLDYLLVHVAVTGQQRVSHKHRIAVKFMAGCNTTVKLCCGGLLHGPGDDPAPVVIFDHHHLDIRVVVASMKLCKGCEVNNDYCTSLGELTCLQSQRQDSVEKRRLLTDVLRRRIFLTLSDLASYNGDCKGEYYLLLCK